MSQNQKRNYRSQPGPFRVVKFLDAGFGVLYRLVDKRGHIVPGSMSQTIDQPNEVHEQIKSGLWKWPL